MPLGVTIGAALLWTFPRHLAHEPAGKSHPVSFHSLTRVDFLGCALLLAACLLLTTGLQQAAIGYSFTSAYVLPLLVCSGPCVVAFLAWQWFVTTKTLRIALEPVFPWRFCQSRVRLGMILYVFEKPLTPLANTLIRISWTNGAILSLCVVQIPQRFMTVNGMDPLDASARFLALGAFVPLGSSIAIVLMNRLNLKPFIIVAIAVLLQILGTGLMLRASDGPRVESSQYGFQVITGTGIGFIISAVMTLIPVAMDKRDVREYYRIRATYY